MSELQNEITSKDIMYILNNPWEKLKGSWKLSNESERQETLQYVKNLLKSSQPDGYFKIWKTPDNNPIAIIGGYKVGDKKYNQSFIQIEYDHINEQTYLPKATSEMVKLDVEIKGKSIF